MTNEKKNSRIIQIGLSFILLLSISSTALAQSTRGSRHLFKLLDLDSTHIQFSNDIPVTKKLNILTYTYLYNGGGVAIGDLNNDGLPEIYFTGNYVANRLYLNEGNMHFKEIAGPAGVLGPPGWDTGVTMVDINNDGYLDIYVCRSGPLPPKMRANLLFINNGDMTFTEKAAAYGLDDPSYSTQAAFFDYNGDGLLDMYLLNHNIKPMENFDPSKARSVRDPYVGDKLYKNTGHGFVDVSKKAGIKGNPIGYGLGIAIGDINNDGWPDIYVGNDFIERDYLYINNGDGTFTDKLKKSMPHIVKYSMGNDIADFNNDGWLDVLAVDMIAESNYRQKTTNLSPVNQITFQYMVHDGFYYQYRSNTLQMNNGNGAFSDVARMTGVSNTDWSWAALMADFDNNGSKDIFITNGYFKEVGNRDFDVYKKKILKKTRSNPNLNIMDAMKELLAKIPSTPISNYMFQNNGNLTFTDKTKEWGLYNPGFSSGAAYGDLDNDGDLDLVINNVNDKPYVYQNNANEITNNHYLHFKLDGPKNNTSGLGSRITVYTNGQLQMIEHYLTRGFQSSIEDIVHFGLGNYDTADSVIIQWPNGKEQILYNVSANQVLTLNYSKANNVRKNANRPMKNRLFEVYTDHAHISYKHKENKYDDYSIQPLLPHKLSRIGPGVAVGDANGDGLEDFYVGGAHGYSGVLYLQEEGERFAPAPSQPWKQDRECEDTDALFFDANGDGRLDLYVVSGGYEFSPDSPELQDRLYINDGNGEYHKSVDALPKMLTSGSVVRSADFNGDGQPDLFVGGRVVPGQYPTPPRSYILKNSGGHFTDVTADVAKDLVKPGMVTDAIWTDYNNDHLPDLIVVGEWMPILIMKNEGGVFINVTDNMGLSNSRGWWFSIAEAGLNQSGRMDYIAGNLGLNFKYKTSSKKPFQIYSKDFDGDGRQEIILGYYYDDKLYPLEGKRKIQQVFPFIARKYSTFDAYGKATLHDIFSKKMLNGAIHYKVDTFATTYLKNTKEGFTSKPLPNMTQLSAVSGILSQDFDKDGDTDIVIAGNLYNTEPITPRNDASIGLYLKRTSNGTLKVVPARISGFYAKGNVKGLALIKLGKNGEMGILVAKNDSYLQLIKVNNSDNY